MSANTATSLRASLLRTLGLEDCAPSETLPDSPGIATLPGRITLVTGPSGCGKTRALRRAAERAGKLAVRNEHPQRNAAHNALSWLAERAHDQQRLAMLVRKLGLADARLLRTPIAQLSAGERARVQLAGALLNIKRGELVIFDEFAAELDAPRAQALALALASIVEQSGVRAIVATHRRECRTALNPACRLHWRDGAWQTRWPKPSASDLPLVIKPAKRSDWQHYAAHHHRSSKLGPTAAIWQAFYAGEPCGIVVYAWPNLHCSARRASLPSAFSQPKLQARAQALNGELRTLQRLVVMPAFRGLGIAALLVRATLPKLGVAWVESIASDGAALERAGMRYAGRLPHGRDARRLLRVLNKLELQPSDLCSVDQRNALFQQIKGNASQRLKRALNAALREEIETRHGHLRGAVSMHRTTSHAEALIPTMLRRLATTRRYFLWSAYAR